MSDTMKEVEGNLLDMVEDGKFDIIIHGCNCFNTMGSGIAGQIKRRYPEAYEADQQTIKGDKTKLGNYTLARIVRGDLSFYIINAYTQYAFGLDKRHTDYNAVRSVMRQVKEDFKGLRISYPMLGAFRGGGDWEIISNIINEELAGEDHTFVKFKQEIRECR